MSVCRGTNTGCLSPRDHAVLEAAYMRNSKPDKHERADIVNQVELGEKEVQVCVEKFVSNTLADNDVQIWFQNRRQNDRRKSKPLQPHELLAHFRNGTPVPTTQQPGNEETNQSTRESLNSSFLDITRPPSRSSSIHELLNPSRSDEPNKSIEKTTEFSRSADQIPTPPSSFENAEKSATVQDSMSVQPPQSATNQASHSRKRSHEVMNADTAAKTSTSQPGIPSVELPPKPLTRSSSFVRLAMTVDGAVKVRTNNEPTPSPPKRRTLPPLPDKKRESFGRSQSAVETGFNFKEIDPPLRRSGGAGFGRSRDARTWEFYCDRDSGDTLSTQAEAERSGSAVGAINLIRSRSQRNKNHATLSPNLAKQNSRRVRVDQQGLEKPKLSRALSSMARLQNLQDATEAIKKLNQRQASSKHAHSPSGDSDKENWAPGTRNANTSMRRLHPSAARDSILQENDFPSARDLISSPAPNTSMISQGQENKPAAVGGKAKATKGDDLDCIQGLLSLSQGAWK